MSTVQGGVYGEGGQLRGEGGQLRGEGGQHRGEGGQLRGKGVHAIHCADDQGIDMALVGKHLCQNIYICRAMVVVISTSLIAIFKKDE